MIGVNNHLWNAQYLGSVKPCSEADWIGDINLGPLLTQIANSITLQDLSSNTKRSPLPDPLPRCQRLLSWDFDPVTLLSWVFCWDIHEENISYNPFPNNRRHQDVYMFDRTSQPKRSFATAVDPSLYPVTIQIEAGKWCKPTGSRRFWKTT